MVSEIQASYRLLEIVSLLLPVVAILLQVSLRLYTAEDTGNEISEERKRQSVQFAVVALMVLIAAAVNTVMTLGLNSPPFGNRATLIAIGIALFLLGYSIVVVGSGAIRAFGGQSFFESPEVEVEISNGRINALRKKGASILEPTESDDGESIEDKENGT